MRTTGNPARSQVQRINRLLADSGHVLRRLRPDAQGSAPYLVVMITDGALVQWPITDLDAFEADLRTGPQLADAG
jgi:hypothetical protein